MQQEREVRVGFLLGQYTVPVLRTPLDHDQHTHWLNHVFLPALSAAANLMRFKVWPLHS